MDYDLNNKLYKLKPYDPISGEYKIRLDANESFLEITSSVKDKILQEISYLKLNRYPDPMAKDVIRAFGNYYNISEKYITAGNGSDELISIITSCFLEKKDKILTLAPDFSMYAFYGNLYELEVLSLGKNHDLTIDVEKVISYCNINEVKALIFSNPCNPTSLGLTSYKALQIINSVSCLVILDEAYMDFWNESLIGEIEKINNLIILRTCSKAIGLAGIRLGFAVASEKITNALRAAKSPYNTDVISQVVGKIVLSEKKMLDENLLQINLQRDILFNGLKRLSEKFLIIEEVYDTKTNFVYIKTSYADKIFKELMKNSIAIRCMGKFLRISAGNSDENQELLNTLNNILNLLTEG